MLSIMSPQPLIKVDIRQALRQKLGWKVRLVPLFLVRKLEKIVRQKDLNALLEENYPKEGAEFCRGVFRSLDITIDVRGEDRLPSPSHRRVIYVSNHPLGGLDGMALIAWLEERHGCEVKFLVNDILMAVAPLKSVFLPINKHGKQSRNSLKAIDDALAGDEPLIIFPAGLVSRKRPSGRILDLKWQKFFVTKAIEYKRDLVPLYFDGKNSNSFYNIARRRKRLGIKFNIEMLYLPREIFSQRGKTLTIVCGRGIPWESLRGGAGAAEQARQIKRAVYALSGINPPDSELDGDSVS